MYSIFPGETFLKHTVKCFVKNKADFRSLSSSGKKLFVNLRKNVLEERLSGINKIIQTKTKQIQSITKELQGLEENLK